jgi:hypothetical protein
MRRTCSAGLCMTLLAVTLSAALCTAIHAQDMPPATPAPGQRTPRATHTPPVHVTNLGPSSQQPAVAYKIVYTISQVEEGRALSSRKFEISADTGGSLSHVHVGKRVLIKGSNLQVGLSIDAQLIAKVEGVELQSTIEHTSLAPRTGGQAVPEVRESRLQTATLMPEGKLVTLGALDDLASSRHYQVTAVITRQP